MKRKILSVLDTIAEVVVGVVFLLLVLIILIGFIASAWRTGVLTGFISTLFILSLLWLIVRDKLL